MQNRKEGKLLPLVFIIPPVIILTIEYIIPFIRVVIGGFSSEEDPLKGFETVGNLYIGDIFYTIFISAASLIITLLLAIFIGSYLRIKRDKFVEFIFKIPLFIPYVVVGHAMRTFLAPHGTLNSLLSFLGLIDINNPPSLAFSSTGIIIALVWKNLAFALLLILAQFQSVSDHYIQAARNFGANFFQVTKDVLVPMCKSSIIVSGIILFSSLLASFSIPIMMGNGEGAQMIMVDLYYRITYLNDMQTANAIGIISFILSFGSAWYYIRKAVDFEK